MLSCWSGGVISRFWYWRGSLGMTSSWFIMNGYSQLSRKKFCTNITREAGDAIARVVPDNNAHWSQLCAEKTVLLNWPHSQHNPSNVNCVNNIERRWKRSTVKIILFFPYLYRFATKTHWTEHQRFHCWLQHYWNFWDPWDPVVKTKKKYLEEFTVWLLDKTQQIDSYRGVGSTEKL